MVKKSIDIVIPIYYGNYSEIGNSLNILHKFLVENMKDYSWNIIIGLNGQDKNGILNLCKNLTHKHSHVNLSYTSTPGRGASLSYCWSNSKSDYVSYMDVDMSSDINYFPKMLAMLNNGYDLITGSRNKKESQVIGRTLLRKIISKTYIALVKIIHQTKVSDTQCGFKALRRESFLKIEPLIENNLWFFDSEMIIIMEKAGFKVADMAIRWMDDRNTTVKIMKDSWEEFSGLIRLFRNKPWKKLKIKK